MHMNCIFIVTISDMTKYHHVKYIKYIVHLNIAFKTKKEDTLQGSVIPG